MTTVTPGFEPAQHLRVSVVLPGEQFDLEAPADEAMDDWLADLVEILHEHGILGETQRATRWFRAGGVPLDTQSSLRAQGVIAGQYLWLDTPPEPRVRLLPDGYSIGRRPTTAEEWSRRTLAVRGRGAIALGLTLGLQSAALIGSPHIALVWTALALLLLQVAGFFALALSARLAELVSWQDWEVYAASCFTGAILAGLAIGKITTIPGLLAAAVLAGGIALAAVLARITRRWQSVFVLAGAVIAIPFELLNRLSLLTDREAIGGAMAAAIILAAASHRVSLALASPRAHEQGDREALLQREDPNRPAPASTPRTAITAAFDRLVTRPGRTVSRARFTQSAVATAALAIVGLGAFSNGRGAIETWYEVTCLLALACFAALSRYSTRVIVVAAALALAMVVVSISALPSALIAMLCGAIAVVAVGFVVDGLVGPTEHPTISAVLVRLRLVLIIAVFALLAAQLSGWQWAWKTGTQLGALVFT